MNITITQDNSRIEQLGSNGSDIIKKMYQLAIDPNNTVSYSGYLKSPSGYANHVLYLNNTFGPGLRVEATKEYVDFEDPVVELLCATKWGDGTGITKSDMLSVILIDLLTFTENTNIQTFDELGDFTNLIRTETFAFNDCTNLRSIDLSNILYFGGQSLQSTSLTGIINLPSVIEIGDNSRGRAFANIKGITEVHIGPNFLRFVNGANFAQCTQLTTVTGLENIASVPSETFTYDSALLEVDISSAKNIGYKAFFWCSNLTNVGELSGTVTVGQSAFDSCTKLQQSCINNANFIFSNNINESSAFYGCEGLTNITFSTSNTTIPSYTFSHCKNLRTITNSQYVTNIGAGAFNQCNNLTSLDFSLLDTTNSSVLTAFATDSPYNFDNGLFTYCGELTTLGRSIFPDITKLGQRSFTSCTKLAGSLIFPDLTTEGAEMFLGCRALEYVYFGHIQTLLRCNTYSRSGDFLNCENLKAIYLGDSINNLSLYLFAGCTNLRAVIVNNVTVPNCLCNGDNQLSDDYYGRSEMLGNSICFLYVPDAAVADYKAAYPWSKFPEAVKPISEYPGSLDYNNFTYTGS